MHNLKNFVDGKFVDTVNNTTPITNLSPATGQAIGTIPASGKDDVDLAVAAAKRALPAWAALSFEERCQWLEKIANLLDAKSDTIAQLESLDTGKPETLARMVDASRSVANFRFFIDFVRNRKPETYEMADADNYVVFKPAGVAALITPWNLPLYLLTWKVAPALVMGNTVVCKPSELTPLTANLLAEVVAEVGLPVGVFNLVHGYGADVGSPLVGHKDVKVVSFTGGTVTGSIVSSIAAQSFKKVSLELGGKNATIVFGDCDIETTVAGVVRAGFTNQGQVCLCGSRLLVQDTIYDDFVSRVVAGVKNLKIGDPHDKSTNFGAVVSSQHRDKILSYISLATEEGGTILCGGTSMPDVPEKFKGGFWVAPTVITGLSITSRCATEEIFGPVITVHRFSTEQEAIDMANGVRYGLAGSVWTSDLEKGKRVAEGIDSGMIWINCWLHRDLRVPFGGTKDSGVGREGGHRSLEFFSEPQNICVMRKK